MSLATRSIPSEVPRSVCTFTILSEGAAVPRSYGVRAIIVHKEAGRLPMATITLEDGAPADQNFRISNSVHFEPGNKIEIKAGYRANEDTIFKGIVIRHSIKIRSRASVLIIECRDEAVKMTLAPKSRYYAEKSDSDIIADLIAPYGLEQEIETMSLIHRELVQYNATDWDFMLCRAEAMGMLCLTNDGKVTVAAPDFGAEPVLTVQYGATIHDLDAEIDARLQHEKVSAQAWDADQAEPVKTDAADPNLPEGGNLTSSGLSTALHAEEYKLIHSGGLKEAESQAWADAMMLRHRMARVRGRVTIDGSALPLPGKTIELAGVGDRFEGKLFVTGVRHEIGDGDWKTTCQFGLDPEWFTSRYDVPGPTASALLPTIEGLHIGIVTKLESDPEGQGRIMVRLPLLDNESDGIWSRIATLDAGKDRGTFFMPELGDEVIVGFINNDPRHAVVLGMCHSGHFPPPLTAADDNHEKGYVSRSGMKFIFNDDKKSVQLETPAGNRILLSEDEQAIAIEDQNGNKLKMSSEGITLTASANIKLEAPSGNFLMTDMSGNSVKGEPGGLTLEGAAKVKISGAQVEVSGGMFKVSAAMADFAGMVKAITVQAPTVIGSTYTPGAGNIM